MSQLSVLIIDTNIPLFNESLVEWEKRNVTAQLVATAEQAVAYLLKNKYNLVVIVENTTVKEHVLSSIRFICTVTNAPIIIATYRNISTDYRMCAHDAGADDIWMMPDTIQEAVAKGCAFIRRQSMYAVNKVDILSSRHIGLDTEKMQAIIQSKRIDLTAMEYNTLKLFILNHNRVLEFEQIYNAYPIDEENCIDVSRVVHSRINKIKIRINNAEISKLFRSKRRVGYLLED